MRNYGGRQQRHGPRLGAEKQPPRTASDAANAALNDRENQSTVGESDSPIKKGTIQ